mgnify:FL=1
MTEPLALRPQAAADMLSVDRTTLYKWERENRLRMVRVGGATLVPMSEIKRILAGVLLVKGEA